MKHTLRSLMFVVTLVCVVLGGRIEYLRRMAVVHEREAERIISDRVAKGWKRESLISVVDSMWSAFDGHPYSDLGVHRALAREYRAAMHSPWTSVTERTPVKDPESYSSNDP